MNSSRDIYYTLPVWAQNLGVNFVSARNYAVRYGGIFRQSLAELAANERKSLDQLLAEQRAALRQTLDYARQHVPYYRKLDCPPDDLSAWPILDKATVLGYPVGFCSDEFVLGKLLTIPTGGTTGSPLQVPVTREDYQREMAFRWRHKAWANVAFGSRGAFLTTPCPVPALQQRPPFWRRDIVEHRLLCSIYHLAPQFLAYTAKRIAAYAPVFLQGFPSTLYALAQYCNAEGITALRPRAVFSGSETLLAFQRAAMERAFGAKVFNWYGTTEMTANIVECAAGNLHCRTDYGYVELLPTGELVCTGFHHRAMPLVRYRVGDLAVAKAGTCACGCAFPLIERLVGRSDEYVRTRDGRWVTDLDQFICAADHIREAQFVQRDLNELVLRIVRADGYSANDERAILTEARHRLGEVLPLRIEYVDQLERTSRGKARFVVSLLPRP